MDTRVLLKKRKIGIEDSEEWIEELRLVIQRVRMSGEC